MIYGKSLAIVPLSIYPNESLAYLEITAPSTPLCFKGKYPLRISVKSRQFRSFGKHIVQSREMCVMFPIIKITTGKKCHHLVSLTYFQWIIACLFISQGSHHSHFPSVTFFPILYSNIPFWKTAKPPRSHCYFLL